MPSKNPDKPANQTDAQYVNSQLYNFCPLPLGDKANGQMKLKLHSEKGETNWLNINADQARQIERILIMGAQK